MSRPPPCVWWPVLHSSWALPRSRPRSSADWTPGHCSSPEHACQTSPQTASHLALFQRNLASEESTKDGATLGSAASAGNKGAELCFTVTTCVSGSRVNSFSRVSLLILESISLELWWGQSHLLSHRTFSINSCLWLASYNKINTISFCSITCTSGKGFVDLRADLTQTQVQRWESGGTRRPSSTLPVTCYHRFLVLLLRTSQRCSGTITCNAEYLHQGYFKNRCCGVLLLQVSLQYVSFYWMCVIDRGLLFNQ